MTYNNINNNFKKAQLKKAQLKKAQLKKAFSLIELSVVVLIIGILIAGITSGSRLVRNSKLASAAQLTKSSDVNSIPDLVLWLEPTQENSFATTSGNTDTLTYANVAGLQDSAYVKDTLRPDNREYVARWNDISPRAVAGNKKSVYQETGSRRPMYIANAINGLPALQFNGTSQYIYSQNNNTTPSAPPLVAGDDTFTVIAVFSNSNNTASTNEGQTIMNQFTGTFGIDYREAPMWLYNYNNLSWSMWGPGSPMYSGLKANFNDNHIAVVKIEDKAILPTNNLMFYLNTSPLFPNTAFSNSQNLDSSVYNVSDAMFTIGGRSLATVDYLFKGYIGEVMVFDRALKNEELDVIMKYLSKKWGIALK